MDLLDEGIRNAGQASVSEGLRLVSLRLSTFLGRQGITRLAPEPGATVDGKRFRVVGSIDAEQVEGSVARLVRAAVIQNQQLLREGELLVARRPS
jgi:hypothetical protein